jgi:segregation and condensation protein B|tara:strand:+ start:52 stop:912 length:861 start_codon:yes stop_codon:yes gene_type:complete
MESLPLKQIIEGAILAAEAPLSIDQLMQLFEDDEPERVDVRDVLQEIEQDCEGRGFELKQVASGYRFQVRSSYGEWVSRLWKEKPPRYSRALLETLALIAYKQPITRGDVEEIRGVAVSTNIMRTLLEREWVRIVGHRDVPGHPALYATTKSFLDYFNLRNLDELPSLSEIKDLTQVNEELDMEDDLIELPSLELDAEEEEALAGMDDADLDVVSDQVDTIQQNIKNLLAADDQEFAEELDEDDSGPLEIEQQPGLEAVVQGEFIASESDIGPQPEIQVTSDDDRS